MKRILIVAVAWCALSGCGSSPEEICETMATLHKADGAPEPPANAEATCVATMEKAKDEVNMFAWLNFSRCMKKLDKFEDIRLCKHKL